MALTLSALHVGAINFPIAAALVLGSQTGTTIKMILGAMDGNASKKRIVLGNVLYNVFITVGAYIVLSPILHLITHIFNIKDPLIGLVIFSSLINLFAVILFLPILDSFTRFLELFFKDSEVSTTAFIKHASISEPLTALDLFRRETKYFIHNSMLFNLELFKIDTQYLNKETEFKHNNQKIKFNLKTPEEKYDFMKQHQGEIHVFYLKFRAILQTEEFSEINQLISAVRSAMHAVKSLKDIESNISNLSNSSKNIKYNFFINNKKETEALYLAFNAFLTEEKPANFENLQELFKIIELHYATALNNFYSEAQQASIEDIDITTIINFNRELFTSNKAMLMAIKDYLLKEKEAQDFNIIPIYKT